MKYGRPDYDAAIQPWPTHRGHIVREPGGALVEVKGTHDRGIDAAVAGGRMAPLIPDDEPVFLIRAQDLAGPDAVRAYARLAEAAGAPPGVVAACSTQADAMERYQLDRIAKTPDLPVGVPEWPIRSTTDDPGRDT